MIAGNYLLVMKEIEGFNLMVTEKFANATEEVIDEHTGGCGPGDFWDKLVPDTAWGESIFLACRIHDWMYYEGISMEDKIIADRVLDWNCKVLIQDIPGKPGEYEKDAIDFLRLSRALKYYKAVFYGGGEAFDKGETPKGLEVEED